MSKIRVEIERYMDSLTKTDSTLSSSFIFPSEFIGFQGHFPTNKVLPGACQIQCVLSTIEKAVEKCVVLKEILIAKFIAPVLPGDCVVCTMNGVPDNENEFICKARITKGTEKISDLKLRICLGDDR